MVRDKKPSQDEVALMEVSADAEWALDPISNEVYVNILHGDPLCFWILTHSFKTSTRKNMSNASASPLEAGVHRGRAQERSGLQLRPDAKAALALVHRQGLAVKYV